MTKRLIWEIDQLKTRILTLSSVVEQGVHDSVKSVCERDAKLAAKVIAMDREVDEGEVEIEEECLKLIALHQPVAHDLRYIVAVLKINNDLERIGDLAVNIAHRTASLIDYPDVEVPAALTQMAGCAKKMLRESLLALVYLDAKRCYEIMKSDDEVDELNRELYRLLSSSLQAQPDKVNPLVALLSVSRNLERIGDHATNISEDVIYMIDGRIVRHGYHRTANGGIE